MSEIINSFQTNVWGDRSPMSQTKEYEQRLSEACRTGNVKLARDAISEGADVNVQFRLALGEISPIFLCSKYGHVNVAQVLVENHVNLVKRMDFDGTTCLHHAAANNRYEMVEFLISQGLDVNSMDRLNRTPLMDAAETGNDKIVKFLIEKNADVTLKDKEGHTALSYCLDFIKQSQPQFEKCATLLIEHGADPNSCGKFNNKTLLHYAASTGNLELCKKLVEQHHALVLVYDDSGNTPITSAQNQHHEDIAEYLMQHIQRPRTCNIL